MSDYSSQTVVQLKELLTSRSLPTDGKKADLVQRLVDNDAQSSGAQPEETQQTETTATSVEEPVVEKEPESNKDSESTLKVIQPTEKSEEATNEEEVKQKPPVLTPEERKQLAVELINKKIQRAEKFGDETAADAARKDLARVEKFGVELGTALAREIGLVDKSLPNGHKKHFKKDFKNKKNFKPNFKNRRRN